MYDRSRRFPTPDTVTGPYIAPNTYKPYKVFDAASGRPCVSSFMALSNRDSFVPKYANKNPPVGLYNVKHPKMSVLGCCTVRNQAKRYVWTQDRNPSPCRYDISDMQVVLGRIKKMARFEKKITYPKFKAPLPPRGVATIPDTEIRFWHEDERTGELVQMPPPDYDRTRGPAFYHVKEDFRADRIKDSHWGNRTAFRKIILAEVEGTHAIYDVRPRPSKKQKAPRSLKTPRFMKAHIRQCYKDNYPGVGTYEVFVSEDPLQMRPLLGPDGERVQHAPFNQSAGLRRIISREIAVPGPGSYPIETSILKNTYNKGMTPFNIIQPRFAPVRRPSIETAYDLPGIGERLVAEVLRTRTLRPGFNICARRFPKPKKKDYRRMPGFLNPPEPKFPVGTAAFTSKKDRDVAPAYISDAPDPTRYNVIQSFKASQEKKKPVLGYTSHEFRQKGIGFWTGARCPQDRKDDENEAPPGPGSFDIAGNILKDAGKFCFQAPRFKEKLEITPGPGQYEVGPDIAENTIPGTLNTTLCNPHLYWRPKYFRVRPENIPVSNIRAMSNGRAQCIKQQRKLDTWTQRARHPVPFFGTKRDPSPKLLLDEEKPISMPTYPKAEAVVVTSPKAPRGSEDGDCTSPIPEPRQI